MPFKAALPRMVIFTPKHIFRYNPYLCDFFPPINFKFKKNEAGMTHGKKPSRGYIFFCQFFLNVKQVCI